MMSPALRQTFFFAVLIAVPVASFFLVFKPQNTQIDKAKKEITHKRDHLDKLRAATSRASDLRKQNEDIRRSIETIESKLPSGKEVAEVLKKVSQIATAQTLHITDFKTKSEPLVSGPAMEQQIELDIVGDFDGFYQFLLELERLPRLTRIPELTLERSDDSDGQMEASMVLSIFYQDGGE